MTACRPGAHSSLAAAAAALTCRACCRVRTGRSSRLVQALLGVSHQSMQVFLVGSLVRPSHRAFSRVPHSGPGPAACASFPLSLGAFAAATPTFAPGLAGARPATPGTRRIPVRNIRALLSPRASAGGSRGEGVANDALLPSWLTGCSSRRASHAYRARPVAVLSLAGGSPCCSGHQLGWAVVRHGTCLGGSKPTAALRHSASARGFSRYRGGWAPVAAELRPG